MTSRRRLRRAQCGNKIGHEDEDAAWAHLRNLGGKNSGVYRCRWCGRWHVGRLSRMQRNGMKSRGA